MGNSYSKLIERTIYKNTPFVALWEITDECNLSCLHCYHTSKCENELSTENAKHVMDELADAGVLFLMFTGGEALSRVDFLEIAEYARRKTFALKLLTNGTLIDRQMAGALRELSFLTVEISIYGPPETHDKITQVPGSYEKSFGGIRYLRELNQRVVIKTPVCSLNFHDYDFVRKLADEYRTGFIFDPTIIACDNKDQMPLELRLSESQLKEYFRPLRPKDGYRHIVKDFHPMCGAGRNALGVSPGGDIYPCVIIKENMGNLLERSLKEIWQSDLFKRYRETTQADLKECVKCDIREYCTRCVGTAILEDGDFLGCSTAACSLAKVFKELEEDRT